MVKIKTILGGMHDLQLDQGSQTLVDDLKQLISAIDGLDAPVPRQRIIFRGRVLQEGRQLHEYGIETESVLHLVIRPETAMGPAPTEPPPEEPEIAAQIPMFMSTVNIPDGAAMPDFNSIIQQVMSSLVQVPQAMQQQLAQQVQQASGQPSAPLPSQPSVPINPGNISSQETSVDNVRQQFNHIASHLSTRTAISDLRLSSDVPSMGVTTNQLVDLLQVFQRELQPIVSVLQTPSQTLEASTRNHAEQVALEIGQSLQTFGVAIAQFGRLLTGVRLGSAPGQESLQVAPPQTNVHISVQATAIPVEIDVNFPNQSSVPVASAATSNSAPDASNSMPPNMVASMGPLIQQMAQQALGAVQRQQQGSQTQATPVPQALAHNAASAAVPAAASGTDPSAPIAGANVQMSSNLQSMLQSLGTILNPSAPAQVNTQRAQSPSPLRTPALGNAASVARSASPARSYQQAAPISTVATTPVPGGVDMMATLMPMVSSILNQSGGTGSQAPNLASVASSLIPSANDSEENNSPLDSILQVVMGRLAMPDLIAMFTGNWACIEPLHSDLRESFQRLLPDDGIDTPANRQEMADEFAAWLSSTLASEESLEPVMAHRLPESDLLSTSVDLFRRHCLYIIDLILSENPAEQISDAANSSATPFASTLQTLMALAVGEWIDVASLQFDDGTTSVTVLLRGAISSRLNALGPQFSFMTSMVGGAISGVLMRCHSRYLQCRALQTDASNPGIEQWMRELPPPVAREWLATISADVSRQREMQPLASFSDAYIQGQTMKRRKLAEALRSAQQQGDAESERDA